MASKKKTSRKGKSASASLPASQDIPEGMKKIGSGNAPTWKPEVGDSLHGEVTDGVKIVEFKTKKKVKGKLVEETTERRVMEVTNREDGERFAVWESAALEELFDTISERGVGTDIYLRFDGLGTAKKGQNAPKLFTVAIAE